jgi:hypothetical protein
VQSRGTELGTLMDADRSFKMTKGEAADEIVPVGEVFFGWDLLVKDLHRRASEFSVVLSSSLCSLLLGQGQ